MITVEVIHINGVSPPYPMSVQIDQSGGTLGRSPDCSLVLTDEKRAVSRIHGQITFRDGRFEISDQGTNPLKVNGVPVGKGNATPIRDGDRIVIGPYELEVRGSSGRPSAAPAMPVDSRAFADSPPHAPSPAASDNPFDNLFGAPASGTSSSRSSSGNPFDDLFGPAAGTPPASPAPDLVFDDLDFGAPSTRLASSPPTTHTGGLPDSFDPMAAPPPAPDLLPPAGAGLPDDAFGDLLSSPQAPGEGSLDALFGLSSGPSSDPFASNPLGTPPPSHAGGTDSGLTQWLGGIKKPEAAAPIADKVPELHSAYQPPKALTPTPTPKVELPDFDDFAAPAPASPAPMSSDALPDFDLSDPVPAPRAAVPATPPAPTPRPVPRAPAATAPARVPAAGPAAPPSELLAALLAGLNAQDLVIEELTPELMFKFGTLMHEAAAGTVALLNARGSVKREMRADVTMIASGRNNPLKFSPDARLALRYLFGPQMPGFMDAEEAMRDAYADLRAHEFGFMAGLRAALAGVLKRFEPGALESRLPDKGGLNALLPMNRKAKLWELFSELYRQISVEAEEDFHALFGREFLRAYEEHIAALERGQQQRK